MLFKTAVTEQSVQGATAAIAATSAVGSWWTVAGHVALEIFGVPIQVVVAALTASFTAQTFRPMSGIWPTLCSGILWAMVGSFGANFGAIALNHWLGIQIATGGLSGVAMLIAGFAPFIAPVLIREGPALVTRWLRSFKKEDNQQ